MDLAASKSDKKLDTRSPEKRPAGNESEGEYYDEEDDDQEQKESEDGEFGFFDDRELRAIEDTRQQREQAAQVTKPQLEEKKYASPSGVTSEEEDETMFI